MSVELSDITFRKAKKTDIDKLVELMNSQYDRKKDERYFLWQYFNSIYPAVLMCAFAGTKLIGKFGLQKRKLHSGLHVGQATDLLVSPEWRGQGIFKMLGAKAVSHFHDLDLICVLPNSTGKSACERAFGWRTVGKVDLVVLSKDSLNRIDNEAAFGDGVQESEKELASFSYDGEIRKWRFDNHPDYSYTYIKLASGEFAVVKIFTDPVTGVRYGDIVDFECRLQNRQGLWELVVKSIMHLKEQDVESITSWALPHTVLRDVLDSLGFIHMPQERYFCLKVLKPEYDFLYDISNWHLVQADSEIY